jgi:(p)ppGpp synthase/HD superfamily hydrolase
MKKSSDETLDLSWADNVDDTFSASIKVEVENVRGVLAMISCTNCSK